MLSHPLGENPFPNIQVEPPLLQLHVIPLGPIIGHQYDLASSFLVLQVDEEPII